MAFDSSCARALLSLSTTPARRDMFSTLSATTAMPTMAVTATICLPLIPNLMKVQKCTLHFRLCTFAKAIELVVERLQADAEYFGRAGFVVARVLERHQDQLLLRFIDGHA